MSRIESILEKATKLRDGKIPDMSQAERPFPAASDAIPDVFPSESRVSLDNPYLVTLREPDSPVTEEYKKLKAILMKLTTMEHFQNTIMVTSAVAGEGKSITSINLAITLAQEYDHTVLLIDADLRKPSITEYLGLKSEYGLSDCLSNKVELSDALVKTGVGKLVVLPAGSRISNPVELVSSVAMQGFLKEIKNRYQDRYIIIDTPPVLSFAEAHSLASLVDGVLFVVRERGATMQNVKDALNSLRGGKVLGVVYNDVGISRFDNDYRYRGYYSRYKLAAK